MGTAKHTPLPWEHGRNLAGTGTVSIRQHTGDAVGYTTCERHGYGDKQDDAEALANAALIVRAVNAHDDLVGVLMGILERASIDADDGDLALKALSDIRSECRAAIAKAEGGASC